MTDETVTDVVETIETAVETAVASALEQVIGGTDAAYMEASDCAATIWGIMSRTIEGDLDVAVQKLQGIMANTDFTSQNLLPLQAALSAALSR